MLNIVLSYVINQEKIQTNQEKLWENQGILFWKCCGYPGARWAVECLNKVKIECVNSFLLNVSMQAPKIT